jgi:hypothetical protein
VDAFNLTSKWNINGQPPTVKLIIVIIILLLLLTPIGLSPGGSSPTLVQTKIKIHKTTIKTKQLQNIIITQNNKITT